MKIGIFYGSETGNTEMNIKRVKDALDGRFPDLTELHDIRKVPVTKMKDYKRVIVGCPTWNVGELQSDWADKYDDIDEVDLSGIKIAMLGCGDQSGYPNNFCDAIGLLGLKFEEKGAELVAFTDAGPYDFDESMGSDDGMFLGLALDEDNEPDKSEDRIAEWIDTLAEDFELAS